jgi:DNA-binding NarL/FixJ family response regulator
MKKILVIEDEPEMRRNLATLLRFSGYKPLQAENGHAGVELARREMPHLILCDVMMPVMDGHSVLCVLHADERLVHIPFVFLTAKGDKQDLRGGMKLGADDYLTKPIANRELMLAIEARLKRADLHMQREFKPDFSSTEPLRPLGLTPRAAEALLWIAQGKMNSDVAVILGITESTVKKYVQEMFIKLSVETRGAAAVRALELLGSSGRARESAAGRLIY